MHCFRVLLCCVLPLLLFTKKLHAINSGRDVDRVREESSGGLEGNLETQSETVLGANWEYEPRVWWPPAEQESQEEIEEEENLLVYSGDNFPNNNYEILNEQAADTDAANVRRRQYFWGDAAPRSAGDKLRGWKQGQARVNLTTKQQRGDSQGFKCDQFQHDIRETVICDKKRCDKLDFEWPKHANQITLIETTKYGMRFHRADYAFLTRRLAVSQQASSRVKFDIFELFKPKTTTSTTTTTTRATTTTTTKGGTATEETDATSTTTTASVETEVPGDGKLQEDGDASKLVTTFRLDTRRPRLQRIIGFGGALSDSTCRNIRSLSPQMAKSLMEDYFGERGLGYTIARLTIGSSDFSTTPYTNNDNEPIGAETRVLKHRLQSGGGEGGDGELDFEMKRFRLVDEDYEFKLPVARQAMATSKRGIKFFSSLWSPPNWMKNNSNPVHGYLKGDVYGPYYKALAEYIVKWIEAYTRNGIEFWATTGLNEPVTGIKPFIFHNSLGITREDYVTFFKLYLGPLLRQRGFQNVKLIALDDNKGYAPQLAKAMLEDPVAANYVSGIGIHWYMNDEYENLNFISRDFPNKFIISTEACNGYLPFQVHALPGNWDRGVAYMYDIIKMIQKNAAGWVDWNMALDVAGGPSWAKNNLDAPIIVNARRDEYYKSPMYYALGHFSRFVEPNSTRLDHRLANARYSFPLEAVAFYTTKGYIVINVLNANKHTVPFKIIVDRQLVQIITLREDSFNSIIFKWQDPSQPHSQKSFVD